MVVSAALLIRERGADATGISDVVEHGGAPGARGVIVTAVPPTWHGLQSKTSQPRSRAWRSTDCTSACDVGCTTIAGRRVTAPFHNDVQFTYPGVPGRWMRSVAMFGGSGLAPNED